MNHYREYPIRCKTCNEQLACLSDIFTQMVDNNVPINEILNDLDLDKACCRIAMLNPVSTFFNMENRPAIDGKITVHENLEPDNTVDLNNVRNKVCLGTKSGGGRVIQDISSLIIDIEDNEELGFADINSLTRTHLAGGGSGKGSDENEESDIVVARRAHLQKGAKLKFQKMATSTHDFIIPERNLEFFEDGIPIDETIDLDDFQEPILIGIPTINEDLAEHIPEQIVYVGAKNFTKILAGRTYLAQ